MKSVMKHNFSNIPSIQMNRSVFDRSFGVKTTFDASYLIPVMCEEILPGDSVNLTSSFFARLATPLYPIMDNLFLDVHYFFVPNRLVWENWQRFYGEQDNPADSTDYNVPVIDHTAAPLSTTGFTEGTLYDYLGYPTKVAGLTKLINLPARCYNLIWNKWYRDENLQDSVVVDIDDGSDDPADYVLLKRGKRKDYFTSALPWPQKPFAGITDVTLPLGTSAPVITDGTSPYVNDGVTNKNWRAATGTATISLTGGNWVNNTDMYLGAVGHPDWTGLKADLNSATASTINSLRQSFQIQKMLEMMARGGSRYIEILNIEFGVVSPDARLQRPEYLGGTTVPVNIHPIANTTGVKSASSPTGADKFQGDLSAMGTVTTSNAGVVKSFVEHGWLFCLTSVRADLTYGQGLDRKFTRETAFDYYRPAFKNLSEQAILRKELFCNAVSGDDEDVWGYVPRYDEYRHARSQLTGLFRHNATGTLNAWHLSQILTNTTDLNAAFISEDVPLDRCIAVTTQPHFICDIYHNLRHTRPLPVYSVPGLIDHL